jgi:hypothetical protein
MFVVNSDGSIFVTRGDVGAIEVGINVQESAGNVFKKGDILRLNVHEARHTDRVILMKDVEIMSDTDEVAITLTRDDTKIGSLINRPVDYWYELELNPDTTPQTLIGYDTAGPKIFRLFPEGADNICV